MKTFATDLSFSDLMLGIQGSFFYSKSFSQTIGKHIPHSYLKEFFPETSFLGKFESFF